MLCSLLYYIGVDRVVAMDWIGSLARPAGDMAAAAGGGTKASANMWAVLADEDPGDNEAAKRRERDTKGREAAEYKHQQTMATVASEAAVGNAQSSAAGTYGRNEKKARNERSRKQRKKLQPVAVANGDANKAVVVQAEEATAVGSDESDGEEESTSCCRTVIGRLLRAAVAAVLIAFWVHAAAPAHTAT